MPGVGLPPEPCITRWGSWLNAAQYYCNNFDAVKSIIESFEDDDAQAIHTSKQQFAKAIIKSELAFIKANFSNLTIGIKKLQSPNLGLRDAVEIIEDIRQNLNGLENTIFYEKFERILKRNKGFKSILDIYNICYKAEKATEPYVQNLSPAMLERFAFCPTTSCDVERSFSLYGNIYTQKRRAFTLENLKHHLIICANSEIEI